MWNTLCFLFKTMAGPHSSIAFVSLSSIFKCCILPLLASPKKMTQCAEKQRVRFMLVSGDTHTAANMHTAEICAQVFVHTRSNRGYAQRYLLTPFPGGPCREMASNTGTGRNKKKNTKRKNIFTTADYNTEACRSCRSTEKCPSRC